ncbi:class I SAM-dependent methyltransferase [Lysinibacillus piscis]|uniref:Methyltransferase n=1 Tax=Lysinibacillus piscis TaxID=2518931 RepID=A0ABQ5NNN6_9BACI|nr:class I SAM-dependent methyltransferase [Lysinibacillus sp. KH24]GLC90001.1 methyltransferase [Lysinibacillus sp. KH24]
MQFDHTLAPEYEKGIRRTLPSYDAMLRLAQSFYQAALPEKATLLIVGSGSGNEILQFAENRSHWTFVGLDPAEAMLEIAQQRVSTLPNAVSLLKGTMLDSLLPDEKFDAASCILVLHFIHTYEEKLATLQAIAAHLKPDAPFVIVSKYGQLHSEETELQFDLWRAYWQQHTRLSKEEIATMENTVRSLSFMPEQDIVALLSQAGFTQPARFFATTLFGGWLCYKKR